MALTILFLGSFVAGLLFGVGTMLWGVEKKPRNVPPGQPVPLRARFTPVNVAAFATLFGAVGYLLLRYTTLGAAAIVVVAAVLGVAGVIGASLLIAKWAVPGAAKEVVDERYVLMGQPARVTRVIDGSGGEALAYEISYEAEGRRHTLPARSLDGAPLASGADVVIERVEDGHAWVEAWSTVERRL